MFLFLFLSLIQCTNGFYVFIVCFSGSIDIYIRQTMKNNFKILIWIQSDNVWIFYEWTIWIWLGCITFLLLNWLKLNFYFSFDDVTWCAHGGLCFNSPLFLFSKWKFFVCVFYLFVYGHGDWRARAKTTNKNCIPEHKCVMYWPARVLKKKTHTHDTLNGIVLIGRICRLQMTRFGYSRTFKFFFFHFWLFDVICSSASPAITWRFIFFFCSKC